MMGNTAALGSASRDWCRVEGPGLMLVELSVVEQRYHAVMEVVCGGIPVVEIAERYGVSRKTVHAWLRRYRQEGQPRLPTGRIARITTRDNWLPRLRLGCASCAGPIHAGDPAGWCMSWAGWG
jgi:hypothetical protein